MNTDSKSLTVLKGIRHIVIRPSDNARLCKDNVYRTTANFGSGKRCVKLFKKLGWAVRAGNKLADDFDTESDCEGKLRKIYGIIHLHEGDSMTSSGTVNRAD